MKIIFAGTPRFAVPSLAAIVREGYEIPAVYTQPDRPAGRGRQPTISAIKELALKEDIPVRQPPNMKSEADYISGTGCDLMVVVAFGVILPQAVLEAPHHGCINVHASLLPRWRGAAPIQRAIEAGDKRTGISIMLMAAGLDTGPVLNTVSTEITDHDTAGTVHDRLAKIGAEVLIDAITAMQHNTSRPSEQDDALACYADKIQKSDAELDWSLPAEVLQRRIRAFNPWPVCQTTHGNTRIRIWEAQYFGDGLQPHSAGTVEKIENGLVIVSCGTGRLGLVTMQRDGGKPLPAEEFLRGYNIAPGDLFGRKGSTLSDSGNVGA